MPWKDALGDRWEGETDEAYRAIGRYVVTFSQMVREMREIACEYVAKGVIGMDISALLLGEAPAEGVSSAFFGMCRTMGELDDEEGRVWSVLRAEVREAIEVRNDIAHGDWEIGYLAAEEGKRPKVMPPRLIRIRPTRTEGPLKVLDLKVKDIDALSDRLEALLGLIQDFGRLALKLPVFVQGRKRLVSKGEFRVRDVLTVAGGKRTPQKQRPRRAAKIVRNGPHADQVSGGLYSELSPWSQSEDSSADHSARD